MWLLVGTQLNPCQCNERMAPHSGTKLLCDLRQIISPLSTSIPSSVKWEVGPDGQSLRLFLSLTDHDPMMRRRILIIANTF